MGNGDSDNVVQNATPENSAPQPSSEGEDAGPIQKAKRWTKQRWLSVLILLGIFLIFVVIYLLSRVVGDAWLYGYFGVFVLSLMASATLIIPIPAFPVTFVMGAILNPWLVALMVGLAEPLGELTGYMAGYSGKVALQSRGRFYARFESWMRRRGSLVLFGFSALPNPFTDIAGMAAGAMRYPIWKFLLVMFAGKTVKGLIVAFAGYWTLRLIIQNLL